MRNKNLVANSLTRTFTRGLLTDLHLSAAVAIVDPGLFTY